MKSKINKCMSTTSLLLLSLLLLSLLPFSISAETVYSEGYFKYTISGDEAAIIEYFGSESEIVIPSSLGGRTVTELRGRIFRSDLPVTKLTLPDTLTEIDDSLLTGLSRLRVVVLQSRSISPRVPSGCVIIEDYPVYVDPDSGKYIPSDTTAPNNAVTSDPGTPRTDGSAGGSDIGGPGGSGVSSSGNSGSGAGDQIDGDSDGTFAEKGISAANGCTITVDNTGNLIMIDRSGNITVIDRGRKYGLAEGEDGIVIADENGDCVRLEDDGLTVVYPDGAGGEKRFRLPDEAETAADTTAYDDAGTVSGKTKGHVVLIAVCASSAAAVIVICAVFVIRRRKGVSKGGAEKR